MVNKTTKASGKLKKGIYKVVPRGVDTHPPASRFQKNFQTSYSEQPKVSPYNTKFEKLPF